MIKNVVATGSYRIGAFAKWIYLHLLSTHLSARIAADAIIMIVHVSIIFAPITDNFCAGLGRGWPVIPPPVTINLSDNRLTPAKPTVGPVDRLGQGGSNTDTS